MRCTLNMIPCSGDLLSTSGMPLALMVQPLALDPAEELIQVKVFLHFFTTFYYYFLHICL
jgi:protein transport protein SEC24